MPHFLPEKPTCSLIVNGLLVAHFYAAPAPAEIPAAREAGRGAEFVARDDGRWSPWHAAVLDALAAGKNVARFEDGDRPATLALLRRLPTAGEICGEPSKVS